MTDRQAVRRRRSLWHLAALALAGMMLIGNAASLVAQEVDCDKRGEREVRVLRFEGNQSFSSDELSTVVLTTGASFTRRYFSWFFNRGAPRCYPDVGLAPDIDHLKAFYQNNGFYDTQVDTVVTPAPPPFAVDITFRINEGQPLRLDSLAITGLDSVENRDDIIRDLQLHTGGRFGQALLIADKDSITARLHNAGYPHAEVFVASDILKSEHRATAELQVRTGALAHFGAISVTSVGARRETPEIDSSVVLRLLGFRTGQQYSDQALADAARSLYNLGTYRHVGLTVDTSWVHGDSVADVKVDLREDYMHEFNQQEGWATLDCFRTSSQYVDKNFLNNAKRLELNGRMSKIGYGRPLRTDATRDLCYRPALDQDTISSFLNYYAGATLTQPTLFGGHWVPAYSAYTERRGEYKAYLRTTYLGLETSVTRNLGNNIPFRAAYTFEYGNTFAQPAFLCATFSACTQQDQDELQRTRRLTVASVSLQSIQTDNIIDPTHGYIVGGEIRGGAPFTGSDPSLQFLKGTADLSWYRELHSRLVVALRFRGGLLTSGATVNGVKAPPTQERLYAGGANSVRGFAQNEVGPLTYLLDHDQIDSIPLPDTTAGHTSPTFAYIAKSGARAARTIPGGGNSLIVVNAELRIRDPFFPDLLEYVPFVDGGEVWTHLAGVRSSPENFVVTPGLGIRYASPIGPIQGNVGYNSNPLRRGPAYFAAPVDLFGRGQAPLLCVTAPGEQPVPITAVAGGAVKQDVASCPATFTPAQNGLFRHFVFTFSIGTSF